MYKNPDPGAKGDAADIADRTAQYFEQEIAKIIKCTYYNRHWTPLSMELRHAAIDEIIRLFSDKMLELKQLQRSSEWKYKSQDSTYPNLKQDLKNFYPGWGGKKV